MLGNTVIGYSLGYSSYTDYEVPQNDSHSDYLCLSQVQSVSSLGENPGDHVNPTPWSFVSDRTNFGMGMNITVNNEPGYRSKSVTYGTNDALIGELPDVAGLAAVVDNNAIEKLYDAVRGAANVAVDLIQAHQTRDLIQDGYKASVKVRKSVATLTGYDAGDLQRYSVGYRRRGNSKEIHINRLIRKLDRLSNKVLHGLSHRKVRLLKKGGSGWLTWIYGIKPTLGNIYDVTEQLIALHLNTIEKVKGRDRKQEENTFTENVDYNSMPSVSRTTERIEAIATYTCSFKMPTAGLDNFVRQDPGSILWELVPFSFIADWFTNIGQYLSVCESQGRLSRNFVGGYVSRLLIQEYTNTIQGSITVGDSTTSYSGSASRKLITFSREVIYSSPSAYLIAPRVELGATRLLTTAALLSTLLR